MRTYTPCCLFVPLPHPHPRPHSHTIKTVMGSSYVCTNHCNAVLIAFVFVTGTCLFAAAFDVGGPGVGYLAISILPLIICTVSVRCIVIGNIGAYYGQGGEPRWSLFFLGACCTILICLPLTLFRLRLIEPLAFLFAVLGIEVQGIAMAISAYGAYRGAEQYDADYGF